MKIAVATMDGQTVSQHFGQSRGFVIFDVAGNQIVGQHLLTPTDTPHNAGACHGSGVQTMLDGAQVVICGGMGAGASNGLRAEGINVALLPGEHSAREAVELYLANQCDSSDTGLCQCDH